MDKIPKVFQNKIDKTLNNNNEIYYSSKSEEKENTDKNEIVKDRNKLNKKINQIFTSPNYIYKANVEIKTKDSTYVTKIIGRNKTHLITMDNKTILIDDIIDIEKK